MKSANYVITPPNLFSGFALENNSFCFVAFVKYQNYEIFACITLSVGYGLAQGSATFSYSRAKTKLNKISAGRNKFPPIICCQKCNFKAFYNYESLLKYLLILTAFEKKIHKNIYYYCRYHNINEIFDVVFGLKVYEDPALN